MHTHFRDVAVALAAAVPALVLVALAAVCAVLGVAVVTVAGAALALGRVALSAAGTRRSPATRDRLAPS